MSKVYLIGFLNSFSHATENIIGSDVILSHHSISGYEIHQIKVLRFGNDFTHDELLEVGQSTAAK